MDMVTTQYVETAATVTLGATFSQPLTVYDSTNATDVLADVAHVIDNVNSWETNLSSNETTQRMNFTSGDTISEDAQST